MDSKLALLHLLSLLDVPLAVRSVWGDGAPIWPYFETWP